MVDKLTGMTSPQPDHRHPSTTHGLSLFDYGHLPDHLKIVSGSSADLAEMMVGMLGDGPELTAGLRKLVEAKDCFVRQAVIDQAKRRHIAEVQARLDPHVDIPDDPDRARGAEGIGGGLSGGLSEDDGA